MKQGMWYVVSAVGMVAFVAAIALSEVMGGCDNLIETASGSGVPMKCHWSFVATMFVGVAGAVSSLCAALGRTKEGRRLSALGAAACAIVVAIIPSSFGIGICASPEMHCHQTAAGVWVCAAIAIVIAIIQIVKADPQSAARPKLGV